MTCRRGYEIKPMKSAAGWYLGTRDKDGFPNCRLSDYARTEEEAYELPLIRQFAEENSYCNSLKGCLG